MKISKKVISLLLSLIMVLSVFSVVPFTVSAAESDIAAAGEQSGDFTYTVEGGAATITGYTGTGMVVSVPDTVGGYTVTKIGENAFENKRGIKHVVLPDTVTEISSYAFYYCTNLESVDLPSSLTTIGSFAFYYCSNLESVDLPSSLTTIWEEAFDYCSSLDNLEIPKALTSVGYDVFTGCSSLKTVTFEEGITKIPDQLFYCYYYDSTIGLEEITIPDTVTEIGRYAFYRCSNLRSVDLPSSLTTIGSSAFRYCSSLESVDLPSSLTTIGSDAFRYCSSLDNLEIPKSLTSVGDYAFSACSSLKTVTFEEGITKIPNRLFCCYSFDSPIGLEEITIPDTVTEIGSSAFYYCSNLSSVDLPSSLTTIGREAFRYCSSLDNLEIPKALTSVGNDAFSGCRSLKTVTFEEGITKIPDQLFYCYNNSTIGLEEITIPDTVTEIGSYAFNNCKSLTSITIGNSVTSIGSSAFGYCESLMNITIGSSVTSIGYSAFRNCTGLTSIDIPDSVTSIGEYAFYYCESLTSIEIPDSVTGIGDFAFEDCKSLTNITIGNSVTSIGYSAFYGCENLTSIEIPDSVTDIYPQAFGYYLDDVKVDGFTIKGYRGTAAEQYAKYNEFIFVALDDVHEHDYEITNQTAATCTSGGSRTKTCKICGESIVETTSPLGHNYTGVITPPTCTERGYTTHTCSRCNDSYTDTFVTAKGHNYGEWIIDKKATIFSEGKKHHICQVCGNTENVIIEKTAVDIDNDQNYGLAIFTVVNAQTKQPMANAGIYISTETEGEATFFTDAEGHAQTVLPVGKQMISVYADGCLTRNLKINISSGINNIPQIGMSNQKTYNVTLTHHLMDSEDIEEAGIDTTAVENHQVYKYELKLEYKAEVDWLSLAYYMTDTGQILGGNTEGNSNTGVIWVPDISTSGKGHFYIPPTETEPAMTIYPVSEHFYLIVHGEVRWMKEMFDIEMLIVNDSMVDTLEDLNATLEIPEGLSLADMKDYQQALSQDLGSIAEGEQKSAHWYVRGDTAGSYNIGARLQGTVMPFDEPIDDYYEAHNPLQVWAGDALHLNFEFPDAAYYGEDYPITITLENTSDITLYSLNHVIEIEQGMELYYYNGRSKTKIERGSWESVGIKEFHPGDKLIIESSVNTFFKSEVIENKLEQLTGIVDDVEQLMNAYKLYKIVYDASESLINCVSGCSGALEGFVASAGTSADKIQLFKQLQGKISSLMLSYSKSGNKTLDAAVKLANSSVSASLNAITKDPDNWLKNHSVNDIKKLLNGVESLENSITNNSGQTGKFDIYDSIRTAISAIPVKFALDSVTMIEDDSNTTSIPWSYTASDAGVHYFGVSNFSKYLSSIVLAKMGQIYEKAMPGFVQLIHGLDDPFNKNEAIRYITTTENEIAQFKAKGATGEVRFQAWVEYKAPEQNLSPSGADARFSLLKTTYNGFELSCDNETAIFENGVLTFTGDGVISVTPLSDNDGILYVQDSNGNLYTYEMNVVPQHTCNVSEKEIVIPPTADYDGFAVNRCDVCGDVLGIVLLSKEDICSEHSFGEWKTDVEPSDTECGLRVRNCTVCGYTEYETIDVSTQQPPTENQEPTDKAVYEIYTIDDLLAIETDMSGNYILMNDLDMSSLDNWEPLGDDLEAINGYSEKSEGAYFSGTFDGNGHRIDNFKLSMTSSSTLSSNDESVDSVGLFAHISSATIHDVHFTNCVLSISINSVHNRVLSGVLCASMKNSTIYNCSFDGLSIGSDQVSGSVAAENLGESYIYNTVNRINGRLSAGILGDSSYGFAHIDRCVNYGSFDGDGITGGGEVSLNSCYNYGDLLNGAGVVSYVYRRNYASSGTINRCYNFGDLTFSAENYSHLTCGGIAFQIDGADANECVNYGCIHYTEKNSIKTTINDKDVPVASVLGGVFGEILWSVVTNCRNYGEINIDINDNYDGKPIAVGGVLGDVDSISKNQSIYSNLFNYGNIFVKAGKGQPQIAGIIGMLRGDASLEKCINYGDITVSDLQYNQSGYPIVGGVSCPTEENHEYKMIGNEGNISIIGDFYNVICGGLLSRTTTDDEVTDCYNTGNIFVNDANTNYSDLRRIGGLVGLNYSLSEITIRNAYSSGIIRVDSDGQYNEINNVGRALGLNRYDEPINNESLYVVNDDSFVQGEGDNGFLQSYIIVNDFSNLTSFPTLDFENIWQISDKGYPTFIGVDYVDCHAPDVLYYSTNNTISSQIVELIINDETGIKGYYWGTSPVYTNNSYIETTKTSVVKEIDTSGTYYATAVDKSGNVSPTIYITFYKTSLDANGGTISPSYVLTRSGYSFAFPTPTRSNYLYNGWSKSYSDSVGINTIYPSSNITYYAVWNNLAKENVLGDVDGDEDVSSVDVTLIQRFCADFVLNISEESLINGDVDGNGDIEIVDATYIQRYLAEFNIAFPIGESVNG